MSTDRDVTRIVRSWLEEGVTTLPDRVLDDVLDRLPSTRQRRAWWPARRLREMNNVLRIRRGGGGRGGHRRGRHQCPAQAGRGRRPRTDPDAESDRYARSDHYAGPDRYAQFELSTDGDSAPGRGRLALPRSATKSLPGPTDWYLPQIPAELRSPSPRVRRPDTRSHGRTAEVRARSAFGLWTIADVFADPCQWQGSELDPPVGPTVDDLVGPRSGRLRTSTRRVAPTDPSTIATDLVPSKLAPRA